MKTKFELLIKNVLKENASLVIVELTLIDVEPSCCDRDHSIKNYRSIIC